MRQSCYSYYDSSSTYKEVEQRWVLFFSEAAYHRECKILDKKIKSVRHESATVLAAESAAEKVLTQHISYLALSRISVTDQVKRR